MTDEPTQVLAIRPWWRQPWLLLIILLATVGMAILSLQRFWGHNTRAFDLGIMSQAIWSVLDGQPLIFTAQGIAVSRLARHVELIYFALAPIYAVMPRPETLLVVQAVFYAAGAVPVYRLASRRLEDERTAVALAMVYLLYPVAMTATLFEFHADTLAMPLLLFMIDALDEKKWRWYGFWLLLSLASKFYVAIPVAVLGAVLWLRGEHKVGRLTFLAGLIWGAVAFLVIRPYFAPDDLQQAAALKATTASYVDFYFGSLDGVRQRAANAMIVILPATLFLGWRAPWWTLVAAVVALPVLLSSGPGPSYDFRFHHYAIAVPFLVASAVFGADSMRKRALLSTQTSAGWSASWYRFVFYTLALVALLSVLLVDTPLNPLFYRAQALSGQGVDATGYGTTSRDKLRAQWVGTNVPDAVPLVTDRLSGLHTTNRRTLYLTHGLKARSLREVIQDVDNVATDSLNDFALATGEFVYEGGVDENWPALRTVLADPTFGLTEARDGFLLFERYATGMRQEVELLTAAEAEIYGEPLHTFGDAIAVHDVVIQEQSEGRYEIRLIWSALPGLAESAQLFAVSRLEGVDDARIVHLPTMVMLPTTEWKSGEAVREVITFNLPEDLPPEEYQVWVGWYDSSNPMAAETDARSRVGDEFLAGTIESQ